MATHRFPLVARVLPVSVIVVVAFVALLPGFFEVSGQGSRAASMGGDFPSFYAAGRIVLDGRVDDLYDPGLQQSYQQGFHDNGEYLYFAYPPFVAAWYAAIGWMPYGIALSIHALVGILAVGAASWMAVPRLVPGLTRTRHVAAATAVALVAYPMLRSILGGQNTPVTLLLLVTVWWATDEGHPWLAGAALAGLAFKPQYAVIVAAYLILARAWRALGAAATFAGLLYAGTAAFSGVRWPFEWVDAVRAFGEANQAVNGPLMVNIVGWAHVALPEGPIGVAAAVTMFALVASATGIVAATVGPRWGALGMAASAMVLLSPSALYYDAAVALFAVGIVGIILYGNPFVGAVAALASWTQIAEGTLGWSPLFLLVAAGFVASLGVRSWPENVSHPAGTLAALAEADGGESTWRVTG